MEPHHLIAQFYNKVISIHPSWPTSRFIQPKKYSQPDKQAEQWFSPPDFIQADLRLLGHFSTPNLVLSPLLHLFPLFLLSLVWTGEGHD